MPRKKREIATTVRLTLTDEEMRKLDEACKYDERCRADFVRIYAIRAAETLLAQIKTREMVDIMQGNAHQMQAFGDNFITTMERQISKKK